MELTLSSVKAVLKTIKFSKTLIDELNEKLGTFAVKTVCDFVTRKTLKMYVPGSAREIASEPAQSVSKLALPR